MVTEENDGKLERLKKALYSKNVEFQETFPLDLKEHGGAPDTDFLEEVEEKPKLETPPPDFKNNKSNLSLWIFLSSFLFFVIALGVFFFIQVKGGNTISSSNIKIDIIGPTQASSGEETIFDVVITNENDAPVELADLLISYPRGTRSALDRSTDFPREKIVIGTIAKGEVVRKTIRPILFGEEGTMLSLGFTLEYRLANSQSVFEKKATYDIPVGTSPVSLKVEGLKEINASQDITLSVTLNSNSTDVVKNLLLVAEFPNGFEVKEVTPKSIEGKTVWRLGDIESGGEKVVKIKGRVYGNQNEEKFFRFSLGGESSLVPLSIEAPFTKTNHVVLVRQPFIGATLTVDGGSTNQNVVKPGKDLRLAVSWENNLTVPILDASIEMKLRGSFLDKKSISPDKGFYRSSTDSITWTKLEDERLTVIGPNEDGDIRVSGKLFGSFAKEASGKKNEEVLVDVTIKGKRLSEDNVPEEIISTISRKLKVETEATLSSKIVHFGGVIANQGVLPPQVDKKTEYTVTWGVTNSLNDIEGAKVVAVLPSYVEWGDVTLPTSEKISFNKESREITWDIGKVLAGGGIGGSFREVSFKIAITPSLSQIGTSPTLLKIASFTGRDTFTGTDLVTKTQDLTTSLIGDPMFKYGDDRVRE